MIKKIHKAGKQLRINLPEFIKDDKELKLSHGDHVQFSKVKLPNGNFALLLSKIELLNENIFLRRGKKR